MGLVLSIHAHGGYDVAVKDDDGEEGDLIEFSDVSLTPYELEAIAKRFKSEGAIVVDYRSTAKLFLANTALAAVEAANALITYSNEHGGVEPEAIEKAKQYAIKCMKLAHEESC